MKFKIDKSEEEWKAILNDEEYRVLRQQGTELPHSGAYNQHFEKGEYVCRGCGHPLFSSDSKFGSSCGWPSFDSEKSDAEILKKKDTSHGMIRLEIVCPECGGHLGHVFNDGPTETGLRYCVNSASLKFVPADEQD